MNIGQGQGVDVPNNHFFSNKGEGFVNVRNGGTVNQNWWINLARQSGTKGHITVRRFPARR